MIGRTVLLYPASTLFNTSFKYRIGVIADADCIKKGHASLAYDLSTLRTIAIDNYSVGIPRATLR